MAKMKPKIFIGSSLEAKHVANAIHKDLQYDAECTVWTDGVFGLSAETITGLKRQYEESDFAICVMAPDDKTLTRKEEMLTVRDNVIYELGLFSGHLGPERCFFAVPMNQKPHLPSDLLGITGGVYEDKRRDGNWEAAVGPFCSQVRKKIDELGFFHGTNHSILQSLIVEFNCCDWIGQEAARVTEKRRVTTAMGAFSQQNPVNKRTLLARGTQGSYVALGVAITINPEEDDLKLLRQIKGELVSPGHAQEGLLAAVNALNTKFKWNQAELDTAVSWLRSLPNPTTGFAGGVNRLKVKDP